MGHKKEHEKLNAIDPEEACNSFGVKELTEKTSGLL